MGKYLTFSFIVFCLIYAFLNLDFYSSFGVALFFFFGLKFFFEIGSKIEVRDIMIIFAIIQWIIGPLLAYEFGNDSVFYYMAVSRYQYMSFIVPASTFFVLGLYLPIFNSKFDLNDYLDEIIAKLTKYKNLDIILIIVGFIAKIFDDSAPLAIRFFVYLIANLRFVGLFLLFFSSRKNKTTYLIIVYVTLFLFALRYALFNELILWTLFIILYFSYVYKPKMQIKIVVLSLLVVAIGAIQTVKFYFRQEISKGSSPSAELFFSLVQERVIGSNYATSETNLQAAISRINQGWIIARIMYWMPTYEPFANGETIKAAISASLVPRFLNPNKIQAGGRNYFTRFTGKDISGGTSMGLSLVGEAYANFGKSGGTVFLFVIGLFFNLVIAVLYRLAKKHALLIFFIPLMFLHVVKAETDFSVVLNYLIKSSMFTFIFFFAARRIFGVKI